MRHGDKVNNLGRKYGHRQSLLSGLACHLIEHKRIVTTVAKAKALRVYVEPLITKSKENTTHQRRLVFKNLGKKEAVTELFGVVSPKVGGRPGGYTRIIKLGKRVGDNAELAMIELVDFNEIYGKGIGEDTGTTQTKKTRRSRRKKSGSSESADNSEDQKEEKTEKPTDSAAEAQVKEEVKEEEEKSPDADNSDSDKEEKK